MKNLERHNAYGGCSKSSGKNHNFFISRRVGKGQMFPLRLFFPVKQVLVCVCWCFSLYNFGVELAGCRTTDLFWLTVCLRSMSILLACSLVVANWHMREWTDADWLFPRCDNHNTKSIMNSLHIANCSIQNKLGVMRFEIQFDNSLA